MQQQQQQRQQVAAVVSSAHVCCPRLVVVILDTLHDQRARSLAPPAVIVVPCLDCTAQVKDFESMLSGALKASASLATKAGSAVSSMVSRVHDRPAALPNKGILLTYPSACLLVCLWICLLVDAHSSMLSLPNKVILYALACRQHAQNSPMFIDTPRAISGAIEGLKGGTPPLPGELGLFHEATQSRAAIIKEEQRAASR